MTMLSARHLGLRVALGAMLWIVACDKVPLLAPTASTIILTADSTVISSTGSTRLTAFVSESGGTPVQNGTLVRFTTTLGALSPSDAQTSNGLATTTLNANGASGLADVRAISGAAGGGATGGTGSTGGGAGASLQITMGSAGVTKVDVRANPAKVPASGGTVEIIALASGTNNRPLSAVLVSFSASVGTLSATTATTDANGEARVTLQTNRLSAVTAAVGGITGSVNVDVAAAASVTLGAPTPATPTAGQQVSVSVTPAAATAPRVVMNWGDGSQTDLGLVAAAVTAAHSYSNPGTYVITAVATDAGETFTTSATVSVGPRPSPTITSSAPTGISIASATIPAPATNFVFTVTPTAGVGIRQVTIDFGEGGSPVDLGSITNATPVSHRFASPGTYAVKATQTDTGGNTTTAVVIITVT